MNLNLKENIFKFFTGENYQDIRKVAQHIKDTKESMRPFSDYIDSMGETRKGGNRIYRRSLYYLAQKSDTIQIIINALNGEIFRNGVEVKEKFTMKCTNEDCGKEFDIKPKDGICDICKSILKEPSYQDKKLLEDKLNSMNYNNQTLLEILEEANTDVERIDDMYYLISYNYGYTDKGIMLTKEFKEMIRINPLNVAMLADNKNRLGRDETGKKLYFCPEHREILINETNAKRKTCPICGKELEIAYYSIGGAQGASQTKGAESYYADFEIIHSSKYQPGLLEGKSNLISCENKVITLDQQDIYIRDCYIGRRSPNGLLLISTANYESFDKAWDARAEKAKNNPSMLYPMVAENKDSDGKNKDWVQYLDLMKSPKEMEMIPLREEYRKQIGAMYRVMPIWMSDSGKGVGQEGLQIVVTNRGIIKGQRVINEKVLLKLSKAIGATDYFYELVPNEKRDEMTEVQLEAQKIQNAVNMSMMGFRPKLNEEKEFEYEDDDPNTEAIDPMQTQSPGLKPKTGITGEVQDQRFEGEVPHEHNSQGQRFCYSEDTELLTKKGWKFIKDVNYEDEIMQSDINFNLSYIKPLALHKYWNNGKMINIKSRSCDLLITPEHKLYLSTESNWNKNKSKKFEKRRADKLPYMFVMKKAGIWKGEELKEFELPASKLKKSIKIKGADWIDFLGIYLSEGYCGTQKQGSCFITQKEGDKKDIMEKIINKLPFRYKYKTRRDGGVGYFILSDIRLRNYLVSFGKSYDKYVPEYIKNATLEQIEIFLNSYLLGDGHLRDNGKRCWYTSSEKMSNDIQEMLIKVNKGSLISIRKELREKIYKGVLFKDNYLGRTIYESKNYSNLWKNKNTIEIGYENYVYNVTVPTGLIVVRRNGRVNISGNSGETQDVHRSEGTTTTSTSGVYNPVHQLREFIKPQIEEVKKEFKLDFKVEKSDLEGLSKFLKMSLFTKAFEDLTKSQSEKIEQVMLNSVIDKISNRETTKKVKELIGDKLSEGEIDRIVRTERGAIKAKSREFSFRKADPEEKMLFKYLGPKDSRTTDCCKRITIKTARGVSLDKMKEIIKEESKKDFPDYEPRDYHSHYNCRHTFTPI